MQLACGSWMLGPWSIKALLHGTLRAATELGVTSQDYEYLPAHKWSILTLLLVLTQEAGVVYGPLSNISGHEYVAEQRSCVVLHRGHLLLMTLLHWGHLLLICCWGSCIDRSQLVCGTCMPYPGSVKALQARPTACTTTEAKHWQIHIPDEAVQCALLQEETGPAFTVQWYCRMILLLVVVVVLLFSIRM